MITAATSRQLACNTDATYRAEQAAYRAYLNATLLATSQLQKENTLKRSKPLKCFRSSWQLKSN